MLGTYKFALVLLIVFSHVFKDYSFNFSAFAFIQLIMISGYFNSKLFAQEFKDLVAANRLQILLEFYVDRFLRLFPQFAIFVVALMLINYFSLREQDFGKIILGFNLQIFVPLIVILPFTVFEPVFGRALIAVSFMLFVLNTFSFYSSELIFLNWLPIAFLAFLLGRGIGMFEIKKRQIPAFIAIGFYILSVVVLIVSLNTRFFHAGLNQEMLLAIAIGFPLLVILSQQKTALKYDVLLGKISYGAFLSHSVLASLIFSPSQKGTAYQFIILAAVGSFTGFVGYLAIEAPIEKVRLKARNFHQTYLQKLAADEN